MKGYDGLGFVGFSSTPFNGLDMLAMGSIVHASLG